MNSSESAKSGIDARTKFTNLNTKSSIPRRAVYTAIIGKYELINEQDVATDSDVDFICFTDDPDATSKTWQIRVVAPRFPLDNVRSARYLKINGADMLGEYEELLWIDNSVKLKVKPEVILDDWLAEHDLAMPLHSFRASAIAEFDEVATHGLDDSTRVYEQLIHYSSVNPAPLNEIPLWSAIIARRQIKPVIDAMHEWSDHVMRYSRRDQLSINYVLSNHNVPLKRVPLDNRNSAIHMWPQATERRWDVWHNRLTDAIRVPSAELGRLQNIITQLEASVEELKASAEPVKASAEPVKASAEPVKALEDPIIASGAGQTLSVAAGSDMTSEQFEIALRNQADQIAREFRESTSWRITRPIRFAMRVIRRGN